MPEAAVALGSNLGDRDGNLRTAIKRTGELLALSRPAGRVMAVSHFFDTAPVGYVDQPRFLNGAMVLETELPPAELMRALLAIERGMGREREGVPAKGPRVIDLDLLLYGDMVVDTTELTLPHPAMHLRGFVLEPMVEIAPAMRHARLGRTVAELLAQMVAQPAAT